MKQAMYCSIIALLLSLFLTACNNQIEASNDDSPNRWGDIPVRSSYGTGTVLRSGIDGNADSTAVSYGLSELAGTPEFVRASESVLEGQSFINFLGMRMIWIGRGNFVMGREESPQRMRAPVNGTWPLRTVEVQKGFWIAQTEITQGQYKRLRGSNPSHFKGRNNPVDSVSWKGGDEADATVSDSTSMGKNRRVEIIILFE